MQRRDPHLRVAIAIYLLALVGASLALAHALRAAIAQQHRTSSGDRPEQAVPLPDPDAPTVPAVGVSAPQGRPVETCARGRKPEQANP